MWRACVRCWVRGRSRWWARAAVAPPWAGPSWHNIVTSGFTGPVYAVNPHAQTLEMEGVPCVASVGDLPGPVDLAVIAVPPAAVPAGGGAVRPARGAGADRDQLVAGARRGRSCWPCAAGMGCGCSGRAVSG